MNNTNTPRDDLYAGSAIQTRDFYMGIVFDPATQDFVFHDYGDEPPTNPMADQEFQVLLREESILGSFTTTLMAQLGPERVLKVPFKGPLLEGRAQVLQWLQNMVQETLEYRNSMNALGFFRR